MSGAWTVLYRGQTGANGTWKVTARNGSRVVQLDRLTAAQALALVAAPEPIEQHWSLT